MTADKQIQSIEIHFGGKLVASITVEDPISNVSSNENFFTLTIGESEVIISAEKIVIT